MKKCFALEYESALTIAFEMFKVFFGGGKIYLGPHSFIKFLDKSLN